MFVDGYVGYSDTIAPVGIQDMVGMRRFEDGFRVKVLVLGTAVGAMLGLTEDGDAVVGTILGN